MTLQVKRFLTTVNAANCYICWCTETQAAVIIDPAEFTDEIQTFIEQHQLQLERILITHGHYDHDSGVSDVRGKYDVSLSGIKEYPDGTKLPCDDVIHIGKQALTVRCTPGHTDDSCSFVNDKRAFVGDAIFAGAVGGTSSREAFEQETNGVTESLFSLPDSCTLFPGHGPATTVGVERLYNPFF